MSYLQLRISDLVQEDSIEYQSMTDLKKPYSLLNTITDGLRTNKKERKWGGGTQQLIKR